MSTRFQIEVDQASLSGRRKDPDTDRAVLNGPLIVALHGGGYSSAFFDVPGYSLLDRSAAAGCTAVALDRPGYGESTILFGDAILEANAERLHTGIAELWDRDRCKAGGIFLVGHSIGGAIAILIAARERKWPLLGIAISGVGLTLPSGGPVFAPNADAIRISVPEEQKNMRMFGPAGTYPEGAKEQLRAANEPVIYREVFEINTLWPGYAREVCAQVQVPVYYRQGELDQVWAQGENEIGKVRDAFLNAPIMDAEIVKGAAHCIDFHNGGGAFQEGQIAFAMTCAERSVPA